ncbi:MAG: hypothetical protein ACRD04_07405 [Terriglobales bacterium]
MNDAASERITALVARCETIPDPHLRADVLELLRRLLDLHREGLEPLLRAAAEAPHLEALRAAWRRDQAVAALLDLHALEIPNPPSQPPPGGSNFVPLTALARS